MIYSNIEAPGYGGYEIIDEESLFADPNNGDFHLKSQYGRWDPNSENWVYDTNTSPCIDTGNPGPNWSYSTDWSDELWPHGKRINMGAYGGTPEASMSLSTVGNIANLDNDPDDIVDSNDLDLFINEWLEEEILIPEDLSRDGLVNFIDYAIFADHWLDGFQ